MSNEAPPVSSGTVYPAKEVTLRAIILGILIGIVMSAANVYLGLKVGMSVSASIPAAVISMGILRGLFKDGTVLENNIVQTIASAGESLAAGIIFTMPALVISEVWFEFHFWTTTLVSMTGGLLGVLFMIPLRRPMIVEDEELLYPEGVACAKVLTAGESGGMKLVFGGLLGAAIIQVLSSLHVIKEGVSYYAHQGRAFFMLGINATPALIGVGFIVGLNIAILVFLGGAISWIITGPLITYFDFQGVLSAFPDAISGDPQSLKGLAGEMKAEHLRYLGVGAMIVGGLWSIIMIRKGIARGIRDTLGGYKSSMQGVAHTPSTDEDMGSKWIAFLVLATLLIVLLLYKNVTTGSGLTADELAGFDSTQGGWGIAGLATILMAICSFFFVAVAAYIVGLVGSSNSPVSGMTICSVLLTAGFIFLFGFDGKLAMLATMGVAGVVCCATCTSGDVCQDLKTGHLVGATPRRQQWMELIGVLTASFVMAPTLSLLNETGGFGPDGFEAPQARLFASLMTGFFGDTELAWTMISFGAAAGLLIILIDQLILKPRKTNFRMHVMPVAVGMYLPIGLSLALVLGGALTWLASMGSGSGEGKRKGLERGVILSSGLIAGEAMAGLLLAAIALYLSGSKVADPETGEMVSRSLPEVFADGSTPLTILTIVVIGGMCLTLIKVSRPAKN